MAQMKQQIKTPEKELSDEEIANLSDAQFICMTHAHELRGDARGKAGTSRRG